MTTTTVVPLNKPQRAAFIEYYRSVQSLQNVSRQDTRSRYEAIDREYQREMDRTAENLRAQAANNNGDTTKFQDMTVPVVMPQVEAAVVYQTSVFLTGHPMFAVVSSPEFIDAALQLESKIEDDSIRGGWQRQFMLSFRDGFKYDFAPMEVTWVDEVTYSIETDLAVSTKEGVPKEIIWSGNRVRRLDPYNTFVDTRVPIAEVHKKGEFAGYTEWMSRIELKSYIAALPDKIIAEIKPAFESGVGSAGAGSSGAMNFYVPDINPQVTKDIYKSSGTNWMAWASLDKNSSNKIDYKDGYEVTTLNCKILPSEFGLIVPNSNTPQIYKLVIVNHEHIIYCERQTNAHGYLSILVAQPKEDGLNYQTKSLGENGKPFQQLATSYMTSILDSQRRAVTDRLAYDPSRISKHHINSDNPSAKIPVKPSAYGKTIGDAVYQFPYRNDQSANSMQQISAILGMANNLNGQNQASQGQFVKGNKTLHEFESVMQNANGRDQMVSIMLEFQLFTPIKEILKLNVLQYEGGTTVYNRDKERNVEIDPVALRKAVIEFDVADGLTPTDKLINPETFNVAMQVFGSSPQIAAEYNIGPYFSYMMKTQGAIIAPFEKSQSQIAYESAVSQWQQLVQLIVEKSSTQEEAEAGIKSLPPQPKPADYGYDPEANTPASADAEAPGSTGEGNPNVSAPATQVGEQ